MQYLEYFEVNNDNDLIDKSFYKNIYEKRRDEVLKNCSHNQYTVTCGICKRILYSEITNPTQNIINQLKNHIYLLEYLLSHQINHSTKPKIPSIFNLNKKDDINIIL